MHWKEWNVGTECRIISRDNFIISACIFQEYSIKAKKENHEKF